MSVDVGFVLFLVLGGLYIVFGLIMLGVGLVRRFRANRKEY